MGLDWMLHSSKPKAGCETQFHRINDKLNALNADAAINDDKKKKLRSDLEAALEQVAVLPFQVIGAPRVGIDDAATDWFRRQVFEPMQLRLARETHPKFVAYWSRPFAEVIQKERGKYVVELAKDQEGVAAITGMLCSSLDFTHHHQESHEQRLHEAPARPLQGGAVAKGLHPNGARAEGAHAQVPPAAHSRSL